MRKKFKLTIFVCASLWLGSVEKVSGFVEVPPISLHGDRIDTLLHQLTTHVGQNENSKIRETLRLLIKEIWQKLAKDSTNTNRWNANRKTLADLEPDFKLEGIGDLPNNAIKIALSVIRPANTKRVKDQVEKINRSLEEIEIGKGYGFLIRLIGDRLENHNRPLLAEKFYLIAIDAYEQLDEHLEMAYTYNDLGILKWRQSEIEKAREYLDRAVVLAEKIPYYPLLIRLNSNIGVTYASKGEFLEAITYYQKSLQLAESVKDRKAESSSLINLGATYARQSMYPEALNHFFMSLEIKEELKDSIGMSRLYNNIGSLYYELEQYKEALGNLKRALLIKRTLGLDHELQSSLKNIGEVYMDTDSLSQAQKVLNESLSVSQKLNAPLKLASAQIGLGRLHMLRKDFGEAEQWLRLSLENYRGAGAKKGEVDALYFLGETAWLQGRYDQATSILENTLQISNEIGIDRKTMETHQLLARIFYSADKFRKAYDHQELFKAFSDSLFNKENSLEIARQEIRSELQIKDIEIDLLNERREAEAKKKVYFMWISGLVFMLALFIYFFLRGKLIFSKKTIQLKQELEHMKSRYFANVNHELRAPISMMLMTIDTLKAKNKVAVDPELMDQLDHVHRNCKKLESLVGEILDADKIENQGSTWNPRPVNLYKLLKAIGQNYVAHIGRKQIKYIFTYMPDAGTTINCDPLKFEKVISNLLSNAFQYTPDHGKVRMIVNQNLVSDQLEIKVQDTGKGIADEDIHHVFDRYYSSSDKKKKKPGLGIGLSMVKEYADLMGAEITVQSKPNKGTVFTLVIPNELILLDKNSGLSDSDEEAVHLEQEERSSIQSSEERPLILVVDDEPEMVNEISKTLTGSYELCSAANGHEAWKMLSGEKVKPALIIMDLIMPEMNGYELIEKVKNHNTLNQIPVVVLTSMAGDDKKIQALRMGVDDYLIKPFGSEELLARVDNQVKRHLSIVKANGVDVDETECADEFTGPSASELEWLRQVEKILIDNVENSKYDMSLLADDLVLSRSQLTRKLKKLTGLSPNKYFREIRLNCAKQLLESGEFGTVSQVAYKVGFDTPTYFSDLYQARFGKKPIEYVRSGYAYE